MQTRAKTRSAGQSRLVEARRVVVKVGSALLVDQKTGRLNRVWLEALALDLGRRQLGLPSGSLPLEQKQAAAAVGQIRLAHAYKELLEEEGTAVAQVLLTLHDSEQRRRYLNARATLNSLLELGAIPVINENDTVATAEIRYGDAWRRWPAPTAWCCCRMSTDCIQPIRILIRRQSFFLKCAASRHASRPWPEAPRRMSAPVA
jgi:Amino acid kinase family